MPGFRLHPGADAATISAFLDEIQQALGTSELAERVLLAAAEVLSNAAEHGAEPVGVEWEQGKSSVVLTVRGRGPGAERIRHATLPDPRATRGRGLFLIHSLASTVEDVRGGLRLTFV